MAKKPVTKKDPRVELSPYLRHRSDQQQHPQAQNKLSASLSGLHSERKKALVRRLGALLAIAVIAIIVLAYYVSPLANVKRVKVIGADDIQASKIVKSAGIHASDKVLDYRFGQSKLSHKLSAAYPEIKQVKVKISQLNQLNLLVTEKKTIGYVKTDNDYRKILSDGHLGSQVLSWQQVEPGAALFVGYNHLVSLKKDLQVFNQLPAEFRQQVKMMSGAAKRESQIIFVMKNGDIVIGNLTSIKQNIKYYFPIVAKSKKHILIDLEVGAFTRPLTDSEKKKYDLA
jgi:cell division protein FtsQ